MSTSALVRWALGLFFLGATVLLYRSIDWVEREVDLGPGEEARRNDFLAAELFLRAQGLETETVSGMALLDALPPASDAIVLSASRESLSARRRSALFDWVERGGKLVVVAQSVFDVERQESDDPLLDAFGVFLIEPEEDEETEEVEASEAAGASNVEEADELEPAEWIQDPPRTVDELLERALGPGSCWSDADRLTRIATADGNELALELDAAYELAVYDRQRPETVFSSRAQIAALPVGEGELLVFTSIAPFRNGRIHCQDHAFFLWVALEGRSQVWLLHDPEVPNLVELARRELPLSTAGGLALLLLAGAAASIRFGVAPPDGVPARRQLREHLEATVVFHYRKGGFVALFDRLREDLVRHGPRARTRWAERAGLSAERGEQVLSEDVPWSRREILRRVRDMLRMRRTR